MNLRSMISVKFTSPAQTAVTLLSPHHVRCVLIFEGIGQSDHSLLSSLLYVLSACDRFGISKDNRPLTTTSCLSEYFSFPLPLSARTKKNNARASPERQSSEELKVSKVTPS